MYNAKKYFSLVTDRISLLQEELNHVQTQRLQSTQPSTRKYLLKEEFLNRKIEYLRKLEELPTIILFSNLTNEQVQELQREGKIPVGEDASYLLKALGLEKLSKYIQQSKIVTMSHIKDAFLKDFDSMDEFLSMNQQNIDMLKKRDELYGIRLDGSLSYLQTTHDERNLQRDASKLETLSTKAEEDFNLETLNEIATIVRNPNQKLPLDFILKHSQKVLAVKPEMKNTIKKLSKRKWFAWANKWLPKKPNKYDMEFIEALKMYYNNHSVANELDISSNELLSRSEDELSEFVSQVQTKLRIRQNQIVARRNQIQISKKAIVKQIHDLEDSRKQLKVQFVDLIRTKTNFFPKSFQEQIWNERDLKESCIREACYLEEKSLIAELTSMLQENSLTTVNEAEISPIADSKVKQLVA